MELILLITSLCSAIAAVLAWAAKLWWGKEFASAKNETIRAKEAEITSLKTQIDNLKDLTPMKIREYFLSVKTQLEEYNDTLRGQLASAQSVIEERENRIIFLEKNGAIQSDEISKLREEKQLIKDRMLELSGNLDELTKSQVNKQDSLTLAYIDPKIFESIQVSASSLGNTLAHLGKDDNWTTHIQELTKELQDNINPFRDFKLYPIYEWRKKSDPEK